MSRYVYNTGLNDVRHNDSLIPAAKLGGRFCSQDMWKIINARVRRDTIRRLVAIGRRVGVVPHLNNSPSERCQVFWLDFEGCLDTKELNLLTFCDRVAYACG